jgi:hypothetical protein
LSTETLQVIHYGADASRTEKIAKIAQWSETYSKLRVCLKRAKFNENSGLIENCCKCEKCTRTMLSLDLLNALPMSATFPYPLKRQQIWKTMYQTEGSQLFYKENLKLARQQDRKDRVLDLYYSWLRSQVIFPVYSRLRNLLRLIFSP